MTTITFYMPQVADWISANDRLHWAKKARLTKTWRDAGLVYARRNRLPQLTRAHIKVEIHKTTARRFDPGNLYDTAKPIVDGFMDYGLLRDDSAMFLDGPDMRAGEKQSKPGLTITITPLAPDMAQNSQNAA